MRCTFLFAFIFVLLACPALSQRRSSGEYNLHRHSLGIGLTGAYEQRFEEGFSPVVLPNVEYGYAIGRSRILIGVAGKNNTQTNLLDDTSPNEPFKYGTKEGILISRLGYRYQTSFGRWSPSFGVDFLYKRSWWEYIPEHTKVESRTQNVSMLGIVPTLSMDYFITKWMSLGLSTRFTYGHIRRDWANGSKTVNGVTYAERSWHHEGFVTRFSPISAFMISFHF